MPAVVEIPEPLPIFAKSLSDRSKQFFAAAQIVFKESPESAYPIYYLMTHAIELNLKAWLACKGTTKKALIALRHDLSKLVREAEKKGLPHVAKLETLCDRLQEMNENHDFRYPTGYNLHLPAIPLCIPIVNLLSEATGNTIAKESFRSWGTLRERYSPTQQFQWTD